LAFNIYAKGDLKASYSVKKWILLQNVFWSAGSWKRNHFKRKCHRKIFDSNHDQILTLSMKTKRFKGLFTQVKKGQTIALVGQSGEGKYIVTYWLLWRKWRNHQYWRDDIKDINLQSLRGLMGLVTQDSILFNDT
jgi:subfamily B ATP-binding cassette protein MsbA